MKPQSLHTLLYSVSHFCKLGINIVDPQLVTRSKELSGNGKL